MVFYKLTDVFPGCSWSTVDFYGVPKIAHYIVQDAYAPGHVAAVYDNLDLEAGKAFSPRIFVVDDKADWSIQQPFVSATLYDATLNIVASQKIARDTIQGQVTDLGTVSLAIPADAKPPYLLKVEMGSEGHVVDRSIYWFNYRQQSGCLFSLPQTSLEARKTGDALHITNTGDKPAVSVHFEAPEGLRQPSLRRCLFLARAGRERGRRHTPGSERGRRDSDAARNRSRGLERAIASGILSSTGCD